MNEQINQRRIERKEAVNTLYRMDLLNQTEIDQELEGYTKEIVIGVLKDINKIDEIIKNSMINYTIDRLSYVDRAIIRVATFEMINGLDKSIAINEAVEITKELSNLDDNKQKAFNNSVLDKISKRIWYNCNILQSVP